MKTELRVIESQPLGETIIEKLEEVLELAEQGELSSIGLAIVYRDGNVATSWSDASSVGLLIAAVARLQHRLIRLGEED